MEQAGVSVDTLRYLHKKQLKQSQLPKSSKVCRRCGFTWPHTTSPCPAKGKTCKKCGKPNHFAKMCLSKSHAPELPTIPCKKKPQQSNVRHIQTETKQTEQTENSDTESTSIEEGVFTIGSDTDKMKVPVTNVEINDVTVIDTGASTDIIDEPTYQLIQQLSNSFDSRT